MLVMRKDQQSFASMFQRTRNDKTSRSQGTSGFSWANKSTQRQSGAFRGPKTGPARYLSEERRSLPRYGFALKQSGIATGRLRTAFTGASTSSKKKEFLQTQTRLEEVVLNLEEAVRQFQDNEMQYKGGQDESGRSVNSQFDGQATGLSARGSHLHPNNRYRDLTAKSVSRATFFNQKPRQVHALGQSMDQINNDIAARKQQDMTSEQYWATKGGMDSIKQSYMGFNEVQADEELAGHSLNKQGQNVNIQDFLERNNHSTLKQKTINEAQYDLAQDVHSRGKSAATQMREDHVHAMGSIAPRPLVSRQHKAVAFFNIKSDNSFGWNDTGKNWSRPAVSGKSPETKTSMQHSRSFQRTAGESRTQLLTESLLNHQPNRIKEVRVKKVLQRYQRMKQRSASVLDDKIVMQRDQRPQSSQTFAKPFARIDQHYNQMHTASGTNFMPRTASLRAMARGVNNDVISSGDLFSPTRRGCTQIKNHIVKKHHDSKIVKAYEVAELVEQSATLLNLNRSRDLDEDDQQVQQISIKIEEPQIVDYSSKAFRSPIRSPPLVVAQPLEKEDGAQRMSPQQLERSLLNNVSFTQVSCEEVSSAIEGSCQMSDAVIGAGQDRVQSATPFKSSVNVGQSNSRVTSQTDPQPSLPISNEQSKIAGSQATKKGSGGGLGRRETKIALKSVRELDLGRHSQALNMPLLSLSSESSHPSELEIFRVKHYGPGDECPYLSKKVQDRASEILEQSQRQFFDENCQKNGSFLKRQSVLLNSVTQTMEKMLVKDQRNGNGAVVKVEVKNLNSLPSLTPEQIDNLFWARMEDLKFGQIPMLNSRKARTGGLKALDRSRGTMQDVYQTATGATGQARAGTCLNIDARSSSVHAKHFTAMTQQAKQCVNATVQGSLNFNQDQKNRFFESCRQYCINRKIKLENQQLGPRTAQELRQIFEEGHNVSQLLLNKNCLGDDGVRILAQCFVGNRKNFIDFQKKQAASPAWADRTEKRGKSLFLIKKSKEQRKALDAAKKEQLNADLRISQGEKSEEAASNQPQKDQDKVQKTKDAAAGKGQKQLSDADASYPSKYSEIVALDLSQNCLTHVGAACLFQALRFNQTLIHLSLGNTDARHKNNIGAKGARYLKDLLKMNQTLTILDLRGNTLCDQGIFQLCQGLRHNFGLMDLNISQNGFSVFGVEFLKDALAANPKSNVRSLDISFNNIEALGVMHLSTMLQLESLKLKSLNVDGCGIQGLQTQTFFRGVKSCSTLRQLRASKNDFSNPALGRTMTLALSYSLQQIHLEYCMLGTQGALNIIKSIESNKMITVVSLKGNSIETIAAQQLGKLLPTRSLHLESLDLSENLLYDEGGRYIAEGLEKNESLKKLFIHCNSLEKAAGLAFKQAVERNRVILVLGLSDNHIDLSLLDEIKGRLEGNKAALSGQEIINMRNEERQIERDKNHYKTETKSSLIRERRGLNRKKRQVREEERKLRSDVAELVAHNRRQEAKLKELKEREQALGYQQVVDDLDNKERELGKQRRAEVARKVKEKEEILHQRQSLQAELDKLKAKLEDLKMADTEYRVADSQRRNAFEDLIALQEHYADSRKLYVNDKKVYSGGNDARDPDVNNPSAAGTKTSSKGKGTTRMNTGAITSPGERSGKGSKGKKEGKKK